MCSHVTLGLDVVKYYCLYGYYYFSWEKYDNFPKCRGPSYICLMQRIDQELYLNTVVVLAHYKIVKAWGPTIFYEQVVNALQFVLQKNPTTHIYCQILFLSLKECAAIL